MPHYVILRHDHPFLHWDLMLEARGVLRTWRLAEPPEPGRTVLAEALGEHRLFYLDYEGPVSGDRGTVTRWDAGIYELLAEDAEMMHFHLHGERLRGVATLQRTSDREWSLVIPTESDRSMT